MSEITESSAPRTDRRRVRTRRQLLEAAVELLLEKDYEDIMTEDITERADIGRRTFYNHFLNKRECYIDAMKGRFADYADATKQDVAALPGSNEALSVAIMAYRVFQGIARDPLTERLQDHPRILSEAITASQRDYMTTNLAEGIASDRLKPSLPIESLEPIIAWGFVGLVIASIGRGSQAQDGLAWSRFMLHNFGLQEEEIAGLLTQVR